jgi:hypothetical protein
MSARARDRDAVPFRGFAGRTLRVLVPLTSPSARLEGAWV